MLGQAVGATGESPRNDRQDAGPTQDARRHQFLFLFAITFENPYMSQLANTILRGGTISIVSQGLWFHSFDHSGSDIVFYLATWRPFAYEFATLVFGLNSYIFKP
jgi:hypothetical protein